MRTTQNISAGVGWGKGGGKKIVKNMFFDQGNFYKILIDLKRLALRLQRGLTLNGVKLFMNLGAGESGIAACYTFQYMSLD